MCGILGLVDFENKLVNKRRIFSSLMISSSRRGKDASGAWLFSNKLKPSEVSIGFPVSGKELIKMRKFKSGFSQFIDEAQIVLGHCRLATNGNADDITNIQPLEKGGLVMMHNGIIVNSNDLAVRFGVKKYNSDSRILLDSILSVKNSRKCEVDEAVKFLSSYLVGTFNLVIIDKSNLNEIKIYFISNNGSLYLGKCGSSILFASERSFLEKLSIIDLKIEKIIPGKVVSFSMGNFWKESILNKVKILEIGDAQRISKNNLNNHKIDFEKIQKIRRCTKCILPETTPFIKFDEKGVCNFCREHQKIKYEGVDKLERLVKNYRSVNGRPDCILAFSGGRDSSYGLHFLVKVLKMHPVAVTFDWGMLSDVGRKNQSRMLAKLGVEHIVVAANIKRAREDIGKNLKAWLKRPNLGMLPLLMQGDKTTEYYVDRIKKELGVNLVFFCRGNELEKEEFKSGYCGVKNADPGGVIHNYYWLDKLKLLKYYVGQFLVNPAYLNRSLWSSFLGYLVTFVVPHDYIYLWHYIPWNEEKIIKTLKDDYNWEGDRETDSTWRVDDGSPAFYNYTYCQIQGFTENDSFRSRQIREGVINRDEAMKIVLRENQPRYNQLNWYFRKIGLNGNKVLEIIDKTPKRY